MKHQSYYETYKATQALEIAELHRCLEAHGGVHEWGDETLMPIVCISTNYYTGDVRVTEVYIDGNGHLKINADEIDGWCQFTIDPEEVMYGHIDFIIDYMGEILTNDEKRLICQAACDLESGNYLIRKRTDEQLKMIEEVLKAINAPEEKRTERQKLIAEEYRLCTDFDYAQSKTESL